MLSIERLSKNVGDKIILNNVCFRIEDNKITGLIGENGAGKSSIIRCIFNEVNFTGSIKYDGKKVETTDVLSKFSCVPDANSVPLSFTVKEYARYRAKICDIANQEFVESFNTLVQALGLQCFVNSKIKRLSSGEKRKAILVAALVTKPSLLILDEPTANLDIYTKRELFEIITKLPQFDISVLVVSHELDNLNNVIDHLLILREGVLVHDSKFEKGVDDVRCIFNKYNRSSDKMDVGGIESLYK